MTWLIGLWLVAAAFGHLVLSIVCVNVLHGLGIRLKGPVMDLASLALLGFAGLGFVAILGVGWFSHPWPTWLVAYAIPCAWITLVAVPAVTIQRALRGPPPGTSLEVTEVRDVAAELGREALVGEAPLNWLLKLPGNESLTFAKVEAEVAIPGLPDALDGLTILHLTDFHFNHRYRRAFFDAALGTAAHWESDLVVFTGDLIDDESTTDWIGPLFSTLRGRLGQFAILGNHDYSHGPDAVTQALREAGFDEIEGAWRRVDRGGAVMGIGGTSSPWGPVLHLDECPADADFRLVLSHSPDQFPRLSRAGVNLVLSGHNHGGQVRIPGFGPILMPSRYSRRYDRGVFARGRSRMYVSQGLGGKHPIRFGGCTPELTRLTLRKG